MHMVYADQLIKKSRYFGQSTWMLREDGLVRKPLARQSLGKTGVNGKIIINPRKAGCKNERRVELAQYCIH
jgi:hypothetical protein